MASQHTETDKILLAFQHIACFITGSVIDQRGSPAGTSFTINSIFALNAQ